MAAYTLTHGSIVGTPPWESALTCEPVAWRHVDLAFSELRRKGPCPLARFVPCLYFLAGVVGQSQPSVGREGINRVRCPVSKMPMPMSTKPIFLGTSVSLLTYVNKKRLRKHGPSWNFSYCHTFCTSQENKSCPFIYQEAFFVYMTGLKA